MTLIPDKSGAEQPTRSNPGPCWRCGGKHEFRETVGSLKNGAPVDFFQCNDCGHVHAVERRPA
jgi:uncharacterized Zn finger protein